ncbi:UPF0193 protein EVG1 homolog [Rhopilema esculentum]|uniref:UPF0193 protein EVG1 homolog n=1 Tax=Rhopilema esculentum TaxID=499914 RepID=UPI0031E24CFA
MAARPKQAVAKGGLWSTKPQNVSKETSNLLKVMMEESKLTNFQRRKLQDDMKSGKSLPVQCLPTSSTSAGAKGKPKEPKCKKTGSRQFCYSGKRRKEIIDILKERNKDDYRPVGGKIITEKDKEKLQNIMAYGKDSPQHEKSKRPVAVEDEPEIDRFEEVMAEIEDRRKFLDEMEALGQGKKYRTIIATEISQKIRELEIIDKERSEELESNSVS